MNLNKFFQELKRRNVFKVATAYAVTAWLIIQIVVAIEQPLSLPDAIDTVVIWVMIIGFPVALIIAWIYEWTNQGLQKTEHVDREESITSTTGKKLNRVIISSLTVLIILLLVERIFFVGNLLVQDKPSVAVLAFENQSTDEGNDFFALGLAEELLNELAHVEGLKVIARTSSFSFKGKDISLKEIAEKLSVDHIITGNVRKSGNQLRISAELINTDDESSVWSQVYDRQLDDIFSIQSEIAKSAIKELKVELLPEVEKAVDKRPTDNTAAYELYLRARELRSNNPDSLSLEVQLLNEAISLDPEFVEAHASIALSYDLLQQYGNLNYEEMLEKMKYHVDEALKYDAENPNVYRAKAWLSRKDFSRGAERLVEAVSDLEKVIELVPNHALAHNDLQITLRDQNKVNEADSVLLIAYELDPLNKAIRHNVAGLFANNGDHQKAIETVEQAIIDHPNFAPLYAQMMELIKAAPYGRIDKAFIVGYDANQKFPRNVRVLDEMIDITRQLDMPFLKDKYFGQFSAMFPENFDVLKQLVQSKFYERDYEYLIGFTDQMLERFGEFAAKPVASIKAGAYTGLGNETQLNYLLDTYFPELRDTAFSINSIREGQFYSDYRQMLEGYAVFLIEKNDPLAEVYIQKINENNEFSDSIIDIGFSRRKRVFSELLKDTDQIPNHRLFTQMFTAVLNKDLSTATRLIEELYFVRRAYSNAFIDLQVNVLYRPIRNTPAFQNTFEKIKADVHQQRAVVVEFLKEKGGWQSEWNAALEE